MPRFLAAMIAALVTALALGLGTATAGGEALCSSGGEEEAGVGAGRSEAQVEDDEDALARSLKTSLLQVANIKVRSGPAAVLEANESAVALVNGSTKGRWPSIGDIVNTANRSWQEAQGAVQGGADALILTFTSGVNATLSFLDQEALLLVTESSAAKQALHNDMQVAVKEKLPVFEAKTKQTLDVALLGWQKAVSVLESTKTTITSSLEQANQHNLAGRVELAFNAALDRANAFARATTDGVALLPGLANFTLALARERLFELNETLEGGVQEVDIFQEAFEEAFEELAQGITEAATEGFKFKLLSAETASSVGTSFAGFQDIADRISEQVPKAARILVSGVNDAVKLLDLDAAAPLQGGASRHGALHGALLAAVAATCSAMSLA